MSDALENTLTRYEGAVNACERDGDDSDAAVKELEDARAALLSVLRQALDGADTLNPRVDSKRWENVIGKAIKDLCTAVMVQHGCTRDVAREIVLRNIRESTVLVQTGQVHML